MGQLTDPTGTCGHGRLPAMIAVGFSAAMALGAVLVACAGSSVDVRGGPLSVTLTADPETQTAGVEITVRAEVVGTSLAGTILDYGDGVVDSFAAFGANTQTVTQLKVYDAAGSYTIVATAEDPTQGKRTSQVVVQINP